MTLAFFGPTIFTKTVGLTPRSRGCKTSGEATTCTVTAHLAGGRYTATITTYDVVACYKSTCIIPGSAHPLSTANGVPFRVRTGAANRIHLGLAGVVASLSVSRLPSATLGTPLPAQAFSVVAKDAGGEIIVGPYDNPVTLSSSSVAATIATSGTDRPPSGELLSSSDTATLSYSGAAIVSASISANASGSTSGSATFVPAFGTGVNVVRLNTDGNAGSPAGTGSGNNGDLRYAMLNANVGDTIVFDTQAMCGAAQCTIALSGPLPPIVHNQTIDGGSFGRVTIDGGGTYRAFFADTGTIGIANLLIQNTAADGGEGGAALWSGGGGAGLGAGLFVNNAGANVTVTNDYFLNNVARGGTGGSCSAAPNGAGGGGLGGAGGATTNFWTGGGGGGVLGDGADGTAGGNGGLGGGGGGADDVDHTSAQGVGGSGYATNAAGAAGNYIYGNGGDGGFGGGGGDASKGTAGSGGSLGSGVSGGDGSSAGNSGNTGGGGGGAAAGPAIFVSAGTLTTSNSGARDASATAGSGSSGCDTNGSSGSADSTPVFNYAGTVNGATMKGPIPNALGNSAPTLRPRVISRSSKDRRNH